MKLKVGIVTIMEKLWPKVEVVDIGLGLLGLVFTVGIWSSLGC